MSSINFKMNVEIEGKKKKYLSKKLGNITFNIFAKFKEKVFKVPFNSFSIEFLKILKSWMQGVGVTEITKMTQDSTTKDLIVTVDNYDNIDIGEKVNFKLASTQFASKALASFSVSAGQSIENIKGSAYWRLDAKTTNPTVSGNVITCTDPDYSLMYSDKVSLVGASHGKHLIKISGKTSNKMIQFVMGTSPTAGVLGSEVTVGPEMTEDFTSMEIIVSIPVGVNVFGIKLHGTGVTEIYQFDVYPIFSASSNTAFELLGTELLVKGKQLHATYGPQIILEANQSVNIASNTLPEGIEQPYNPNSLFSIMGINTTEKGILLGNSTIDKTVDRTYSDISNSILPASTAFLYTYPTNIVKGYFNQKVGEDNQYHTTFDRMIIANGTVKANDLYLIGKSENYSNTKKLYSWDKFPTELSFESADAISIKKDFYISQSVSMGGINANFLLSILYGMILGKTNLTVAPIYPFFIDDACTTYTKMAPTLLKVNATETETFGIVLGKSAENLNVLKNINFMQKIGTTRKTFKEYTEYDTLTAKFTKGNIQITEIESEGDAIREFSIKRMFTAKENVKIGSAILLSSHPDSGITKYFPLAYNLIKGVNQEVDLVAGQSIIITFTFSIDHTDDITAL